MRKEMVGFCVFNTQLKLAHSFPLYIHWMGKSISMNFNELRNANGTVNTYLNRTTIEIHSEVICSEDNANSLCTKSYNRNVIKADCCSCFSSVICNTSMPLMHAASISLISSWKEYKTIQIVDKIFLANSNSTTNADFISHLRTFFSIWSSSSAHTISVCFVHFDTLYTSTIFSGNFPLACQSV